MNDLVIDNEILFNNIPFDLILSTDFVYVTAVALM